MGTLETLLDFINKYYWEPIEYDLGYNSVNTVTYALILGISIFGVLKLLNKKDVKSDWEFIKVIIPYVIAGSSLRVFEDAELFDPPLKYIFITPLIYFLMFAITVVLLFLFIKFEDLGILNDWKKAFGLAGIFWALINLGILLSAERITNPAALIFIPSLATGLTALIYIIAKNTDHTIFTQRINISIIWVHLLDASSTFYGMDFLGYYEKHVVPTLIINLTGTASVMLPLKIIIFIPMIYILDTQFDEDDLSKKLRDLLKLTIIILGLAPGTRNTIRMVLGI